MKTRESGMPPEDAWHSFFEPAAVLVKLGLTEDCDCVVDFGCGYGTFSLPAAAMVRGTVHAIDIDPAMVDATKKKALHLPNLKASQRDFVEDGCGLPNASAAYVMLFNILHAEESGLLMAEARRVLRPNGKLGVMHWNYDPSTPRGPSMSIRLRPEACKRLVMDAGFTVGEILDLPPFHYGFVGIPSKK